MAKYTTKRDIAMALALETGADFRTAVKWVEGRYVVAVAGWAFEKLASDMGLSAEVERIRAETEQEREAS